MDQYPQLFAYPSDGRPAAVPNMMVIGGVKVPSSNRWDRSAADPPGTNPPVITVYAPAEHLTLPWARGGWRDPDVVQGVSYGRQ